MQDNLGASAAQTGLAGAEAPEPPSRLGPTGGIPCAGVAATRERLAAKNCRWAAEILEGAWDETPAFRKAYGEIRMEAKPDSTQFAVDMTLLAIDKINFLRGQMEEAVRLIVSGKAAKARQVLDRALEETDVGTMKVWQPDEEPF